MKLTGNRCKCSACGEFFNSVGSFDFHRTGPANARTCLDPEKAGMERNTQGFWVTQRMPIRTGPAWTALASGKREGRTIAEKTGLSLPEKKSA